MGVEQELGFFNCRTPFESNGEKYARSYFRPASIELVSGPPPMHSRLVIYKMWFWPQDQFLTEFVTWPDPLVYALTNTLQNTFSFTIKPNENRVDVIMSQLRNHFYDVVQKGMRVYDEKLANEDFYQRNLRTTMKLENELGYLAQMQHRYKMIVDPTTHAYTVITNEFRYVLSDTDDIPVLPSLLTIPHQAIAHDFVDYRTIADEIKKIHLQIP